MISEFLMRLESDVNIVNKEELVWEEEISDDNLHDALELLDGHTVNVADLHYLWDDCLV